MKNIAWLALIALLESLQLIIIVALIYSFIPIPFDNFYYTIFPFFRHGLYQKRDLLFYRIFVGSAILLQAGLLYFHRKLLKDDKNLPKVRAWAAMAIVLFVPQFFLIYQIWLGPHPKLARQALMAMSAVAMAARIFWPEVYALIQGVKKLRLLAFRFPDRRTLEIFWKNYQDAMVLFLLTSAIGIQTYLYAFAVYGWNKHLPLGPSSHPWNYIALFIICLTVGLLAIVIFDQLGILKGFKERQSLRTLVEGVLSFFLLNALFEIHVYYYQPQLAQRAYVILLVLTLVVKLGWLLIKRFLQAIYGLIVDERNQASIKLIANAGCILFIFLYLYVPDLEAAVARIFIGEQFHSIEAALMNTSWAYHAGCSLNLDVNNRYGLGMAVMTSLLSNLLGGCTYLNVYAIVMSACIIYFIAAYGLLRHWLNSVPIAIAGILICLKMQPFHEETSSIYFTNPTSTVCRYFFDIPCLWMMLLFLRSFKKRFILAAAGLCAVALFYSSDTGVYLSLAYYALLIMMYAFSGTRVKMQAGGKSLSFAAALVAIPPLGALALLRLSQGPGVFSGLFWKNMMEYIRSQLWFGPIHIWETLGNGDVWLFSMGLWIIVAYTLTMLIIASQVFLKKIKIENLFVVVVCIYGLALYNYHVNRTSPTNCYTGIFPYVFILCYWVGLWAKRLSDLGRKKFYLCFLALCLYSLWTTHLTLAYPNVFNFSHNPAVDPLVAVKQSKGRLPYFNFLFSEYPEAFKLPVNNLGETSEDWRFEDDFSSDDQLKQYFRQEFHFPQDAALIDRLTAPDQAVPLISSFEIQMLIEANRKPFFYIFPLVNSRPMRMRLFEVTHMWTTTQMDDTIKQLEDQKPPYVFMERIYLAGAIPQAYLYDMPAVCALDNYVRQHYVPYAYGKYLVAMKLKN